MSQKNSPDNKSLHFFVLGREWRLSIAELCAVFGLDGLEYDDEKIAVFSGLTDGQVIDRHSSLGGSIFAGRIDAYSSKKFDVGAIARYIAEQHEERTDKILFSISSYPDATELFERSINIKKRLRVYAPDIAIRAINTEKEWNPSAVPIRGQGVLDKGYGVVEIRGTSGFWLGRILAAQNVDEYTKRDTDRLRDMQVGMLPPKLAQIMCNLAGVEDAVYDPFCGLGTVLIEANARKIAIYGSDSSDAMVRSSRENLASLGMDATVDSRIFKLDAGRIVEVADRIPHDTPIVTEGTLGPILSQTTITRIRVAEIDSELAKLYDRFFAGLKELGWTGRIAISFPCFRLERADVSADRCIESFDRHGFESITPLPARLREPNRRGMLYRRPDQTVGREIFILELSV